MQNKPRRKRLREVIQDGRQQTKQRRLNFLLPIYFAEAGVASAFLEAITVPPCGIVVWGGSASNVQILRVHLLLPIYFEEAGVA